MHLHCWHGSKSFPALLFLTAGLFVPTANSSDWPQFLGPTRNGLYLTNDLADSWPKEGPGIVWQKVIGHGFAGPAVVAGKLVLFHRLDNKETVECLDAKTGG